VRPRFARPPEFAAGMSSTTITRWFMGSGNGTPDPTIGKPAGTLVLRGTLFALRGTGGFRSAWVYPRQRLDPALLLKSLF
jgi:hypothetical protein